MTNPLDSSRRRLLALGLTMASGAPISLRAQTAFPNKPIRILVPFPAGGAGDVSVRTMERALSPLLGVPMVVENRPGADGAIAVSELMRSAPDGYTIMFGSATALLYVPLTRVSKPPYDPMTDLEPISHFASFTFFLIVHEDLAVSNLAEFVSHVKSNPGKIACGTGDSTSLMTLAQLQKFADIEMNPVAYKGTSQALPDFVSGRIQVIVGGVDMIAQTQGKGRALAVMLPRRSGLRPEVPTFAEAGYPEVNLRAWTGFFAPARTPPSVLDRLSSAFVDVFEKPDVKEYFALRGSIVSGSTPAVLRQIVVEQMPIWREAIRIAKVPIQ